MRARWQVISDSPSSLLHDVLRPLVVIAIFVILTLLASEISMGIVSLTGLMRTEVNLQRSPNIAIYQDSNCTIPVSHIDWGSLGLGTARNTKLYIRNEGTGEVGLLLATESWTPANISAYLNLTWNYDGVAVFPGAILEATLTLSSSSSPDFSEYLAAYDVREFTFGIIISAIS